MEIQAENFYGTLPFVMEDELEEGDIGELDTLNVSVLVAYPNWKTSLTNAGYTLGRQVGGYASMFVSSTKLGNRSSRVAEVRVQCVGLISAGDKRKRRLSAAGQVVSVGPIEKSVIVFSNEIEKAEDQPESVAGNKVRQRVPLLGDDGRPVYKVIVTPSGYGPQWDIMDPIVTVEDTYFTITKPSMVAAGTASIPIQAPQVPPYQWSGYGDPLRLRHPNGWVLVDRVIEEVCGTTALKLYRVIDSYAYYHPAVPA